ncbi:unnamed protein product [Notodromas monacha]|uniref:PX domain-containing protein n=1 Tax=Notodromas monacha TaxID=399045 RepID=A0A7R9BP31_9CRUS|nr:unnamed protein product [Notodromas monacha]CAG0918196.1 unnamed protein product [Notodromas monacha]
MAAVGEDKEGEDVDSRSSDASTPEQCEEFRPRFRVEVLHNVIKDGEILKYTLNVTDLETGSLAATVKRQYEDFEYLEHCVSTSSRVDGVVAPAMPPRPPIDAAKAEEASRRVLGSCSRGLLGDEYRRSCRQLQRYVNALLEHRILGKDVALMEFLTKPDPPARAKVKKGILARLSDSLDARRATHPDCDEFFQKQRDWLTQFGPMISDANDKFDDLVAAECRMCGQLTHLTTALSFCLYPNTGANAFHNQFQARFSDALEAVKEGFEVMAYNDEATLSMCLDWYARSVESLNGMLFRRTCLMVDYETSNKNLDRAKPHKKEAAEKLKKDAEKAFEECSDVASLEIKKYHRARVQEMQDAICKYAEVQAMTSRDTYALLASAYAKFKELPSALNGSVVGSAS